MEVEYNQRQYRATPEEVWGIDRGLSDAAEGKFASGEDVEAVFAKYRRVQTN